jgi:hypothetical protein
MGAADILDGHPEEDRLERYRLTGMDRQKQNQREMDSVYDNWSHFWLIYKVVSWPSSKRSLQTFSLDDQSFVCEIEPLHAGPFQGSQKWLQLGPPCT